MTAARARPPLYPVLVAPLWAITLWSSARESVGAGEVIAQVLFAASLGAAALFAAARLVGPDRGARAATLVAIALLWPLPELVALCVLALAGILLARGPGPPSTPGDRTSASFATGLAATLIASAAVASLRWPVPSAPPAEPVALAGSERPDVWWILLDGHARADWLQRRFQLDEGLSDDLAERGFFVADRARANYGQTLYSVLATLNLDYVDAMLDGDATRARVAAAMRDTRLARSLREAGYRTVFWPGGYRQLEPAFDENAGPRLIPSEYHLTLLGRSLPGGLAGRASEYSIARRWRAWFVKAQLAAVRPETGGAPAFHLVHVLSPHPPFVASGEGRSEKILDGSGWENNNPGRDYREGYARQVEWLRPQVIAAVDRLRAGRRAVIVVSSDHGSGFGLDWGDPRGEPLADRLAILWALQLPNPPRDGAPPSDISLVNTFRIVLREALGADLSLLPDRSYAQSWTRPEQMWSADGIPITSD